jgi:hypothetical protein
VAAVFALAGCGAVTSEEHKIESSAKQKVESVARHGTSSFSQKDVRIKLPCHASPAKIKSAQAAILKKYGAELPSASTIARAISHAICS